MMVGSRKKMPSRNIAGIRLEKGGDLQNGRSDGSGSCLLQRHGGAFSAVERQSADNDSTHFLHATTC
jgi:hypothetical protein